MAHDQFEIDPGEIDLRQRALLAGLHRPAVHERDAAFLQGTRSRRYVARAKAEAHQSFVPVDFLRPGRRLDQLQIELAAGGLEQRASRPDAEILALRQHRGTEPASVKVQLIGWSVDLESLC